MSASSITTSTFVGSRAPKTAVCGVLRLPRTVLVGAGQRHATPKVAASVGRHALVCTDPRLYHSLELRELVSGLEAEGLAVAVYGETGPELPTAHIQDCVAHVKGAPVDLVIGFGGGSCIDMAKVISVLLAHGGQPRDYYGEMQVPGPALPVLALPTTAGTGSEATAVAVVHDLEKGTKVGISSPHLIPVAAICDPELTYTCPPWLTAAAGADALVHLVESFTAIQRPWTPQLTEERVFVGRNDLTDIFAREGILRVGRSLATAYRKPLDAPARGDMTLAALYGGIALCNAGTAAAHAIQYPVGALTHTPHGVGVGLLLPYVVRHNFAAIQPQLGQIATALGRDVQGADAREAALVGVEAIDEVLHEVEIPTTLADLGLSETDLDAVSALSLSAKRLIDNNPVPLELESVSQIVRAAFDGDRSIR